MNAVLEQPTAETVVVPAPGGIDVLYVAFNRFEFTRQSFEALLTNTDWERVRTLYVHDDGSTDGSTEYLGQRCEDFAGNRLVDPYDVVFHDRRLGGPVAAMNWYLDAVAVAPPVSGIWAKIDNDFIVCPGWLPEMLRQMELHPGLDILGTEPFLGNPAVPGTVHRDIEPAVHIGGKGLIRHRAFKHSRPVPGGFNGYQGFTQWQHTHPEISKAWIKPDLPCFGIDQLPLDYGPWRELAEEYAAKGWQRLWPCYGDGFNNTLADEHYAWWTPA